MKFIRWVWSRSCRGGGRVAGAGYEPFESGKGQLSLCLLGLLLLAYFALFSATCSLLISLYYISGVYIYI